MQGKPAEPLLAADGEQLPLSDEKTTDAPARPSPKTTALSWVILVVLFLAITSCNIILNALPSVARHMAEVTFKVKVGVINNIANLTLLVPIVAHFPASFTVDYIGIRRR
jgi:hypothetical protein